MFVEVQKPWDLDIDLFIGHYLENRHCPLSGPSHQPFSCRDHPFCKSGQVINFPCQLMTWVSH